MLAGWGWSAGVGVGAIEAHSPSLVALAVVAPVAASVAAPAAAAVQVAVGAALAALVVVLAAGAGAGGAASAAAVFVGSGAAALAAMARASGEDALVAALRSGERERRRRRALEARSRVDRLDAALAECGSVGEVAETVFAFAQEELGVAAGMLGLVEPGADGQGILRVRAAQGYRPDLLGRRSCVPLDPSLPSTAVLLEGRPLFVPAVEVFARRWPAVAAEVRAAGFPSLCILPLVRAGRARGLVAFSWPSHRRFADDDRQTLLAMAEHLARALERATAVELQGRARRRLSLLADVTRILASSLDLGVGARRLAELLAASLVDGAAVVAPAPEGSTDPGPGLEPVSGGETEALEVLASAHRSLEAGSWLEWALGPVTNGSSGPEHPPGVPVGTTVPDGSPALATPPADLVLAAWRTGSAQDLDGPGGGQLLALPMVADGATLGVLVLVAGLSTPPLGLEERALAQEVAGRAAGAAALARRFAQQRHLAVLLQRSLLPQALPSPPGLALCAEYRPGTTGTEVGGDWFDALVLADGRVLVGVGDVAGKGIGAATVMGQLRTAVRAYALVDPEPERVLARLDALLGSLELGAAGVASAVLALVDPKEGTVRVASAGHPPALLVGPGRSLPVQAGRRPLLGAPAPRGDGPGEPATAPAGPASSPLRLAPGETLLLYSDGLVERRDQAIGQGIERLAAVAAKAACDPAWPEDAARHLLRAAEADGRVEDDAVVLALTWRPPVPRRPAPTSGRRAPGLGRRAGPRARGWLDPAVANLVLAGQPESVPAARAWVRAALADRPAEERARAELLVDELVANAVLHAGTTVRVALRRVGRGVHVEVADDSRQLPHRKLLGVEAATGRGLLLLDRLADDWGVVTAPAGKAVWFSLGVRPRPSGRAPRARLVQGDPRPMPLLSPAAAGGQTVVLLGVPARRAHAALGYYEALVRELRLLRADGAKRDALVERASRLRELGGAVLAALAPALGGWPPGPAPADEGPVDLRIEVPVGTGEAAGEVSSLLDAFEAASSAGQLLLPPPPPDLAALRRWVLAEVAGQCDGKPPSPWGGGLVLARPRRQPA